MNINSIAVCLVVLPESFVDITVCMPKLTSSVCFVEAPLPFVFRAVRPDLGSRSVSGAVFQVTLVDRAILKNKLFNELKTLFKSLFFQRPK